MADWPPLDDRRTGLSLHKAERLTYWTPPERAADAGKYGGMVPVSVEREGRLIVALDRGAWLDLVRDGTIVPSAAHGHGPACSGIRKMVEYEVTPGRYLLQISNAPESSIRAMAVMRD
ncbi:homogentisate 1,2-dioxygenase [Sphingopyxis sp. PET50]|uniref:homogentisate 1,2-dioxygenase n=1 Tax=Sphingopyxis sp. PET50 TaxID=2976533 RepID=UPI0021AE9B13|nr:homogentisate 1,2-dioxygenase [Sphingopyxis sp. PET50]